MSDPTGSEDPPPSHWLPDGSTWRPPEPPPVVRRRAPLGFLIPSATRRRGATATGLWAFLLLGLIGSSALVLGAWLATTLPNESYLHAPQVTERVISVERRGGCLGSRYHDNSTWQITTGGGRTAGGVASATSFTVCTEDPPQRAGDEVRVYVRADGRAKIVGYVNTFHDELGTGVLLLAIWLAMVGIGFGADVIIRRRR